MTTTTDALFAAIHTAVDAAQRATTTAERERIAELERDNNALRAQLATYQTVTAGTFGGVPVVEVKPAGPWVVERVDREFGSWLTSTGAWSAKLKDAYRYDDVMKAHHSAVMRKPEGAYVVRLEGDE